MKMKFLLTKHPILFFLGVSFLTFLINIGIIFLIKNYIPEYLANFGSFMEGTLGTAISLGGAIAVIYLAYIANETLNAQENRESYIFLERVIEEITGKYKKIIQDLNELLKISQRLGYEKLSILDNKITTDDITYRSELIKCLENLASHLDDIFADAYSKALWKQKVSNTEYLLDKNLFFNENEKKGLIRLPYLTLRIKERAYLLAKEKLVRNQDVVKQEPVVQSYYLIKCGIKGYALSLCRLGFEFWAIPENNKIKNLGLALIIDLVNSIPKDEEVRNFIFATFEEFITPRNRDEIENLIKMHSIYDNLSDVLIDSVQELMDLQEKGKCDIINISIS